MERLVLKALDFNIVAPTALTFLLRFLKAAEVEQLQASGPAQTVELMGQTIAVLSNVSSVMEHPMTRVHPQLDNSITLCSPAVPL